MAPFFGSGSSTRGIVSRELSPQASHPNSFIFFPLLPLEWVAAKDQNFQKKKTNRWRYRLRCHIWYIAAVQPHVIPITMVVQTTEEDDNQQTTSRVASSRPLFVQRLRSIYHYRSSSLASHDRGLQQYQWTANCTSPVTLFINHESRAETLRFFKPAFAAKFGHPIYISPTTDILFFLNMQSMESFLGEFYVSRLEHDLNGGDNQLVHHVAFISHQSAYAVNRWCENRLVSHAKDVCPNLQQLIHVNIEKEALCEEYASVLFSTDGKLTKSVLDPALRDCREWPSVLYLRLVEE